MKLFTQLCMVGCIVAFATSARADIYQWQYNDPADPSQGKQQSTTLCPDGAGVNAEPATALLVACAILFPYLRRGRLK